MNIEIRQLKSSDIDKLSDLISIYADVFEMEDFIMPPHSYFKQLLLEKSVIFFVAELKNKVIGGLTAHILPSTYFQSAEIYIYDLGVMPQYQRKGVGNKLITTLKDFGINSDFNEIYVQAETLDQHAVDFYKKIGGIPEEGVVHFSFPLDSHQE